ncbi:MAG: acyl-homoserine-lactone acylase [Cyclobacteriaceae bacterium]|jgi:acyl-homoserine-lactone acylase
MNMKRLFLLSIVALQAMSSVCQRIQPTDVEIMRDEWGVPHIYAPTDAGVAYGLAWAHAEDDFATTQLTLLSAKQMLGRHLGKDGAPIDYVVGLLNCEQVVKDHIQDLSPDFIMVMEGYVQGINAYAASHPKEVLVKKAFPATVNDMMQAYVLSLSVLLGADKTIQNLFENKMEPIWDETKGSNAFAFGRQITTDSMVYLAVNAHQPLEGPVSWYEAHLISDEGWNMMGGLFPGGATIFHGTNENLGWAHTVNHPDKLDVWQLKMHPTEKLMYEVDGKWNQLGVRKIALKIKLFPGFRIGLKKKAYSSIYGPVVMNDQGVFAFDMASLHDLRAPEQWYRMNKAYDFESFKSALDMMALPMFNIVYADKNNEIFYVSNAKLPKRNAAYDWEKVVPGISTKALYNSYFSFDELPQVRNPRSGYVYNTNHSAFLATAPGENADSTAYDRTMGYKVWNNNRSLRLKELITAQDSFDYDDFLRIKYDAQLPDTLMYFLDINGLFVLEASDHPEVADLIDVLKDWDRSAETASIGPAQFIITYYAISEALNTKPPEVMIPTTEQLIAGLVEATSYLIKHFGAINISLGSYQKLARGEVEFPLRGMPDVLAAMYGTAYKEGKVKGFAGDSYIMLVRYPKEGLPMIETVNAFGASAVKDSPHYTDQMQLFVDQKRKPMTLDLEAVRKSAKRIYHPQK